MDVSKKIEGMAHRLSGLGHGPLGQAIVESRMLAWLCSWMKDADARTRECAALTLGIIGHHSATSSLMETLNDVDFDVRVGAARALVCIGAPVPVSVYIEWLKIDDTMELNRYDVLEGLGSIGDPAAIPAIVELLNDADEHLRSRVATALGDIKDPTAIPALMKLREDSNSDVSSRAERALKQIYSVLERSEFPMPT